jgi:hypothetical protein
MAKEVRDDDQLRGGGTIDVVVAGKAPHLGNDDSAWEIEEISGPPSPPPPAAEPPPSDADDVYVAVGKGGSSMAALSWALRQLARPRSFVYLVHVFPAVATIPTPCKQADCRPVSPPTFSPSFSAHQFWMLEPTIKVVQFHLSTV